MNKFRFKFERAIIMASTNVAYVDAGEDPLEEIIRTAVQDMSTDIVLTIGGVTNHLAAWEDPDHWSEDWRELAGDEDVDEFIFNAIASAVEE